jgi:hypothetical protein
MIYKEDPVVIGGLIVLALFLLVTCFVDWFNTTLGEAVYLAVVLVTTFLYLAYESMIYRKSSK